MVYFLYKTYCRVSFLVSTRIANMNRIFVLLTFLLLALMLFTQLVCSKRHKRKDLFTSNDGITKKGLVEFALMILQVTGRNPLDYNGYGCWCGLGGKGTPVDATDWCCYHHDHCYESLHRSGVCLRHEVYHKPYLFWGTQCYTGWLSTRCGRGLCYCDAVAAKCFKRETFNRQYMNWPQSNC